MTNFADTIELSAAGANLWDGTVDPDYRGFGSQFGGWTSAALLKGAMVEPGAKGEPLSLSVLFTESISDGPYQVSTRLLRSGARLQFWRSELAQNGKLCAHAQATFGVRRDTVAFTDAMMPDPPPPDDRDLRSFAPPSNFGAQYHMRWITPGPRDPDHDPNLAASSLVWIRDKRDRPVDVLMLAAMADLAPPRVMWKKPTVMGSSTVSMTTHFHATAEELREVGPDWILSEVHCRRCEGGYFDHELKLWSRGGVLLATSEQVASFRD